MSPTVLNQLYMSYLEHSIRYYEWYAPIVDDALYDRICQALLRHWPTFRHSLKDLTDTSALAAGTGYQLVGHPRLARLRSMLDRLPDGKTLHDIYGQAA